MVTLREQTCIRDWTRLMTEIVHRTYHNARILILLSLHAYGSRHDTNPERLSVLGPRQVHGYRSDTFQLVKPAGELPVTVTLVTCIDMNRQDAVQHSMPSANSK